MLPQRSTNSSARYFEAVRWLRERGGAWSVRATRAACIVVAVLGTVMVEVPALDLSSANVDDALVDAVEQLRDRVGESA